MKTRTLLITAGAALILLVAWRPWAGEEAPAAGAKGPTARSAFYASRDPESFPAVQ